MFFCGLAGQRLEPVSVVGRALLERPALHAVRNVRGYLFRQDAVRFHTFLKDLQGRSRNVIPHGTFVKDQRAEIFACVLSVIHVYLLLLSLPIVLRSSHSVQLHLSGSLHGLLQHG